jgi:hypothetical protein
VKARRFVRKMRGSCHAHLIEADDNACYVVKSANNPQSGRRTLINETLAGMLFGEAGIATPAVAYVAIDGSFLRENSSAYAAPGKQAATIPSGLHFGSRMPVLANHRPIYDFLPDRILADVQNRRDFLGALAMDKWLSNGDARQAIFYRDGIGESVAVGWIVQMIDHGAVFQGSEWTFRNSPAQGVYARRAVYGPHPSIRDFEPWLDVIAGFRPADLEEAAHHLPREWIAGEEMALDGVLKTLYARRAQTRASLAESIECFWSPKAKYSSLVLQFCAFH